MHAIPLKIFFLCFKLHAVTVIIATINNVNTTNIEPRVDKSTIEADDIDWLLGSARQNYDAILHYAIPDISVIASVEAPNTLVTIINELIPRAV